MTHSTRATIVWWIGCLGLALFVAALVNGFQVVISPRLPFLHLALSTVASWLVLLVFSWFGLFSLLGWGLERAKADVMIATVVFVTVVGTATLGFFSWEEPSHYTTAHRAVAWVTAACQLVALLWFRYRRQAWFPREEL